MKILVVNYEYPPVGGGGGDVAKELSKQFVKQGHEVEVFTIWFPGLPREEVQEGVRVRRIFGWRRKRATSGVFEMAMFLLLGWFPYLRAVRRYKPDMVHVHFGVPTGVLGFLSKILFRVPYVITAHLGDIPGGSPQTDHLFPLLYPFTIPIWYAAERVVTVSQDTARLVRKAYPLARVAHLPNGVDTDVFFPLKKESSSSEPVRVYFGGRLNIQKDLGTLFKALHLVDQRSPGLDWRLTIAGDGPMAKVWQEESTALGLQHKVQFLGWINREQVVAELQKADIFVLPSLQEGMPISCLQAMAVGLPIVATDTAGTSEVVRHEQDGLLVPIQSPEALSQALEQLIRSSELRGRYGLAGLQRVKEEFSWFSVAKLYVDEFQKALRPTPIFFLARLITYNRGDLASRAGTIEGLRRAYPNAWFYVLMTALHAQKEDETLLPVRLGWIKDLIPHWTALVALVRSTHIIWSGGVDLQDDTSRIKIPYIACKFLVFRLFGKPIFLYAQGMGPLTTAWGKWWVRRIVSLVSLISVRDEEARLVLVEAGVRCPIHVVADAALSLTPSPSEVGTEMIRKTGLDATRPIVGMNLRRWFHHGSDWIPYEFLVRYRPRAIKGSERMEKLIELMARVADEMVERYSVQILLVPMYPEFPEWWEDDVAFARAVFARIRYKKACAIYDSEFEKPADFAAMISQLSFMVGMRLHSTIVATHMRVPSVHVYYTQKGLSYFMRLQAMDLVFGVEGLLGSVGAGAFQQAVLKAYEERDVIRTNLESRMPVLEESSLSAAALLRKI